MPAAIDKAMIVAIGGRHDGIISLYSLDFNERKEFSVAEICPQERGMGDIYFGCC